MTNFNDDLFAVLTAIFEKHDQQTVFRPVAPWADDLWGQLQDGGFTAIGADATLVDHAAIAKAVGKNAIALPVSDVGLARWVADTARLTLPRDSVVVCAGLEEQDRVEATFLDDGRVRLDGVAHRVPWGRHAAAVLLPVSAGAETRWVCVDRDLLEVRESVNLASEPRDDLRFLGVESDQIATVGARPREARARGGLLRTVAAVGAMEFVLDASLVHAEQRQQFGRPISGFQAVQHHLVLIAEAVASVSAAVDSAICSAPESRLMMVAAAKAMLGEQAAILTRLAHQVFGAIGTTEEHPIQTRTRRLWSWQDEFGTTAHWAADLAEQLVFPESPGAWPVLTPPLAELSARDVGERVPW
ncbi:alkylation response protein AidB-like acyl-CoA dehydrogenase [Nocardioides salarius]|uniref:Alkylation response protein AidB-like acyl-CoA dehydrogenase n=1 Tax=Nocardioides salarius TaxID=374513 RepID=A0ABS2MA70_9ACTN|nr:acyl-CoA dehydrogenase [Nocardioides salarius]MBM7508071.1 alkylation response protein AidB-like acyl-CoA dehydrogenase [Nocardioides salarius]